jgi:hypothetical protein
MISIDGLNQEQIEMLDKLWSMDTVEEVNEFRNTLPRFRQQQIDTLMELVIHEMKEKELSLMERYPEAEEMLERLKKDFL